MFKSIFGRMFWTYAILLVVVLSSIALSLTALFSNFAEREEIKGIESMANVIEDWTVTVQIEQPDIQSKRAYKSFLLSCGNLISADIVVVNRNGDVLESTCGLRTVPTMVFDGITDDKTVVHKSDYDGFYENRVMSISFPLHYKGNIVGAVIFNRSLPEMREAVFDLLGMFLMSSLLSIALAFVIIYIQAKRISAPIAKINKAAQNIAKGDFTERVRITSQDEIGQLASTFNFMASNIEKSQEQQQRFVSDVSHELRTPMTSITGFVEGMLDGTISDNERNSYLEIVRDESVRLTKLVNDMLEVSKVHSQDFKPEIAPFDINDLICSSLISLETKIEEKGLDISVDFNPSQLMVLADKDQIKRVLINLLDNAIKFSFEKTSVIIKTSIWGGKAHISISNTSEMISQNELDGLFDRFYKTDKSREIDRTGAGLGLSLVKNILRVHNQTITAKNEKSPDGEHYVTTFEFTLELK